MVEAINLSYCVCGVQDEDDDEEVDNDVPS